MEATLVPLLALLVALAQLLPQYFIAAVTGLSMEQCLDKDVESGNHFGFACESYIQFLKLARGLHCPRREAPHVPSDSTASIPLPHLALMPDPDEQAPGDTLGHCFRFKAQHRNLFR